MFGGEDPLTLWVFLRQDQEFLALRAGSISTKKKVLPASLCFGAGVDQAAVRVAAALFDMVTTTLPRLRPRST